MKNKLKLFLKQFPPLYQLVQAIYWKIRSLRANLLGTKLEEKRWAEIKDKNQIIKEYWEGRNHPHRQLLIKRIEPYSPISSILEIGCNCGQNLYLLAKKFPQAEIKGIDINSMAIQIGNELFKKEDVQNIELLEGRADELSKFPDKSFDIVFTDAVLMYIGPDKIKKTIKEMVRISRKSLVLIEWHVPDQHKDSYDPHIGVWKRDYVSLLEKCFPKEKKKVSLSKIPKELWPDENWQKLGYLIEIKM
jgi:ubiquinone/menaquinone biosynthesis C-methylase UbiE